VVIQLLENLDEFEFEDLLQKEVARYARLNDLVHRNPRRYETKQRMLNFWHAKVEPCLKEHAKRLGLRYADEFTRVLNGLGPPLKG
jgi:hypothetical protein